MYLVFVCFLWSLFNVSKLYHSHLKAISCHFVSIFVTKQKPQNDMKQMLCGCSLQHWGCILKIVFFFGDDLEKTPTNATNIKYVLMLQFGHPFLSIYVFACTARL